MHCVIVLCVLAEETADGMEIMEGEHAELRQIEDIAAELSDLLLISGIFGVEDQEVKLILIAVEGAIYIHDGGLCAVLMQTVDDLQDAFHGCKDIKKFITVR